MKGWRRLVGARLQRRLFVAFGATIMLTLCSVGAAMHLTQPEGYNVREHYRQVERFAGSRFAKVWDEPAERAELARGLSESFGVGLVLKGPAGENLESHGPACEHLVFSIDVERAGKTLGSVSTCPPQSHRRKLMSFLWALAAAVFTVWMGSGMIARKIARPLRELASVTRDLGRGKLKRRARLRRHDPGEMGELAESINEMAERIAKQLEDQRELLAGVSHEIRTPLARMRVLIDLLEDAKCDPELSSQLEREVVEIDQLTEDLLASSRLEFQAVNKTALDGEELIRRALERCNLSQGLAQVTADDAKLEGDATLLGRALANLLQNAVRHGGGAEAVELSGDERTLTFSVRDGGGGFSDDALSRAFDRFYQGQTPREKSSSSLGLGLALVRRIARAHGGEAFAENVPGGGARVGFSVARKGR